MHIGLIIYGDLETLTGGYLYDRILVHHLRQKEHKVSILSLPPRTYGLRFFDMLKRGFYKNILQQKFDLLLQDELCHPSLLRLNRKLRQQHIPIVTIVHQVFSDEPRNGLLNSCYRVAEKHYFGTVDGFVFNSATTRQIVWSLGVPRKPHIIAPPGGDRLTETLTTRQIVDRARQPGPLRLLFLGNVMRRKGLIPLIQGLTRVDRNFWRLAIVGDQTMERGYCKKALRLVASNNLESNITFHGAVDGPPLKALLASSHLLSMPYAYEGFGIATLESLGMGLPVIGSSAGATAELVTDGYNGYLISPEDSDALGDIITSLYRNRKKLIELSLNGVQSSTNQPVWSESMTSIEIFLRDITGYTAIPPRAP